MIRLLKTVSAVMFIFCLKFSNLSAQNFYISVADGGAWNSDATWDMDGDGLDVETDGIPGPDDIAAIIGNNMGGGSINITSNVVVGDIFIQFDNTNVLSKTSAPFITNTLTINGQLSGFDFYTTFDAAVPNTTVIENDSRLNIVFTGDNIASGLSTNPAITSWSHSALLRNVTFNPSAITTNIQIEDLAIFGGSTCSISNGTLTVNNGFSLAQSGSATLNQASGTTLVVNGAINGDGTSSSRFSSINLNGTVSTGVNGYINSENFNLGSGAVLNITFNGPDQTQGWWFQNIAPNGTVTLDPNSTVAYSANANQNVASTTYGNLLLSSTISASVKSLQTTNTLIVSGDLSINSANVTFDTNSNDNPIELDGDLINNGTWSPDRLVSFSSTISSQSITGDNPVSFDGGVRIENTFGTVSLFNQNMDINGILDIDPSASFDPDVNSFSLSGNFQNDGTLVAGTVNSTVTFDGNTSITGTGLTNFNDIVVANTLTSSSGSINVFRDFINNGTFNSNNGTVVFNGAFAQSITGSNATTFYNLQMNNDVDNEGTAGFTNLLTLGANVEFDADGNTNSGIFIIESSENATAIVDQIPGSSSIVGNVTYERYITTTPSTLLGRQFAVPLVADGSVTLSQFSGEYNIARTFSYNETVVGGSDEGWFTLGSGSIVGSGIGLTGAIANTTGGVILDARGELTQGNFPFGLSYTPSSPANPDTDGWNFISNPYAAPIDWSSPNWTKGAGVNAAVYVWNSITRSYMVSTGSSGDLPDHIIPSGQSFWVQTNGTVAPVLTATEGVKATTGEDLLYRRKEITPRGLTLELANNEKSDKVFIEFRDDASDAFDYLYDAHKLSGSGMNLAMLATDSSQLVVNAVALGRCQTNIPLSIYGTSAGTYELSLQDFNLPDQVTSVGLEDYYLNTFVEFSNDNQRYSFSINNDLSSYQNRFRLVFSVQSEEVPLAWSANENILRVEGITLDSLNAIEWFFNGVLIEGENDNFIIVSEPGDYQATIKAEDCVSKSEIFTSSRITSLEIDDLESMGTKIFPNPVSDELKIEFGSTENYSSEPVAYELHDSRGVIMDQGNIKSDGSHVISMREYSKGFYILKLIFKDQTYLRRIIKE